MSPGSSTESYPAFAHIRLRENPRKNLNQVTCPDRDSNPGHLVSQPDALTVTPQPTLQRLSETFCSSGVEILQHPPYAPDLSPCDFDLILQLKPLYGKQFASREDILTAFQREMEHID
ncbi:hypothetical protein ANN_20747 [Periplaneta americana]|uniref:Histone-lysine N-methyltransferase SETMAR n=1 Tax=Periplaneta americana TaxID=6978 RepID=A0ABQ8SDG0_PERAM|nr:hypothetical protein ANN_20747 [Periplaneta americana]